jgi:membrane-bound lytic murein transglycosylase D
MVHRNVHLEQIAGVLGLDIDMLRSLNPEFRHDVVPGLTKPYAIRLPLADTGRFIDNEDSIYAYRASELLNKRIEVTINDDVPTYSTKKAKTTRRNSRASRNKRVVRNTKTRRKATTTKRRTPAKKTTSRARTTTKKKTTRRR